MNINIGLLLFSPHEQRVFKTILKTCKDKIDADLSLIELKPTDSFEGFNVIIIDGREDAGIDFYNRIRPNHKSIFVVCSSEERMGEVKLLPNDYITTFPIKHLEFKGIMRDATKDILLFGIRQEGKLKSKRDNLFDLETRMSGDDDYGHTSIQIAEEMEQNVQQFANTVRSLFLKKTSMQLLHFTFTSDLMQYDLFLSKKDNLVFTSFGDAHDLVKLFKEGSVRIDLDFIGDDESFAKVVTGLPSFPTLHFVWDFAYRFKNSLILDLTFKRFKLTHQLEPWVMSLDKRLMGTQQSLTELTDIFSFANGMKIELSDAVHLLNGLYLLNLLDIATVDVEAQPKSQGGMFSKFNIFK